MSKTYSAGIVTAYGAAKRAGYQGTYEDFCRQQAGYAESAAAVEAAKTAAQTAANTATAKASEASASATAAQTAKTQTEAAASQALTDIGTARTAAISALHTEGATQTANAKSQAQAAAQSANTASTKASEASASATSAGQSATNAAASATSAANAASAAQAVLESIPEDYSDLSEDVDQLKADLGDVTEDFYAFEENKGYIPNPFRLGVYTTVGTYRKTGNEYRICTTEKLTFNRPVTIKCAMGFEYAWDTYNNGTRDNGARWITTDKTIPANKQFTICIQKTNPNTSEIANISLFKKAITINTIIDAELQEKADITNVFTDKYVKQKNALQNIIGVRKFEYNLVIPEECADGYYISYSDGGRGVGSDYFCTGYIEVSAGTSYKSNLGRNYAWYNSDKTYISGASGTGIQSGITAPENAKYIRFTVNKTSDGIDNPLLLYFADTENYNDDVYIDGLVVTDVSPWCYGKKINWIGDSIVDGPDFDEVVCNALGLTKLTTDGVDGGINGSTISLKGDGTNLRNALCLRYSNMPANADIIAVSCGTNDFQYAWCPIGDIESTSNSTFYGALKTLCEGLINKYPQKLIFFTTPIKRAQAFEDGNGGEYTEDGVMTTPFSKNKYGKTLGDYADIIKEVCGYYSIPVLDMYRESLLNPHLTSQQSMFDNVKTHPNTTGQKIMARRVAGWITQLGYLIE